MNMYKFHFNLKLIDAFKIKKDQKDSCAMNLVHLQLSSVDSLKIINQRINNYVDNLGNWWVFN